MAIKPVNLVPGVGDIEYLAPAGSAFTAGTIIYRDVSLGTVHPMTATVGDATNVEAIVLKDQTVATANPYVRALPITSGLFVVADCTNTTASDQLNKAHLLTDAGTVNNTNTHSTDVNAVFVALKTVGASTDKKLFGYIAKLGQVTA